jgi:hypothetical protein
MPQIAAARAQSTLIALRAQLITPMPAEKVTLLPSVTSLWPEGEVSAMMARTLS